VIVGCESSGVVREAFRRRGHDAYSCDLQPADDGSPFHLQGNVLDVIYGHPDGEQWDLGIFHPTCTYLCLASVWAFTRTPRRPSPSVLYGAERRAAMQEAAEFFLTLYHAPIARVAVENPLMHGEARAIVGPPTQRVQPFEFGDDASKRTCLWLRELPPLVPTAYVAPRIVAGRPRWANQTDSGQNRLAPSPTRWKERSRTYPGIAAAMAEQWGDFVARGGTL
jgi:hypothetical protein